MVVWSPTSFKKEQTRFMQIRLNLKFPYRCHHQQQQKRGGSNVLDGSAPPPRTFPSSFSTLILNLEWHCTQRRNGATDGRNTTCPLARKDSIATEARIRLNRVVLFKNSSGLCTSQHNNFISLTPSAFHGDLEASLPLEGGLRRQTKIPFFGGSRDLVAPQKCR